MSLYAIGDRHLHFQSECKTPMQRASGGTRKASNARPYSEKLAAQLRCSRTIPLDPEECGFHPY